MSKNRMKNLRKVHVDDKEYKWLAERDNPDETMDIKLRIWDDNKKLIHQETMPYCSDGVTPAYVKSRIYSSRYYKKLKKNEQVETSS